MEKINTKQVILNVALDFFSVQGYEATSIAQIADAVGIKKASLYSHFESKKDILDTLIRAVMKEVMEKSAVSSANWGDPDFIKANKDITIKDIERMIKEHFSLIINEPIISKTRKLLTIEQFQNPELKTLQTRQSYESILGYSIGLMKFLIDKGELRDDNPDIMAAQFAWPISMWINLCDREPERQAEAMELIGRHIEQFFRVYKK